MEQLDKEVIEELSEPAKRVFRSLDYRSQGQNEQTSNKKPCNVCCRGCQKEKIADVNKSVCGFVTTHTLFFL